MRKVTVGVIGYGFAGKVFHAPLLDALEEFDLVKIVSSRTQQIKEDLPNVEVIASVEDIWEDDSIELVVVATPNSTHFELAKAGLSAGKHMVVDKPFVNRSSEGKTLINLAKQKKRCLSVYHNRRFDNDFLTIKEILDKGELGKINTYIAHYDRFRPKLKGGWKEEELPGSGVLFDLGSHLIDQALVLFGMPITIFADFGFQRDGSRVTDFVHLVLNYDEVKVILHVGTIVANPGPHFQIHGDKGSFVKYGMDSQEASLIGGNQPGDPGWGEDTENFYGTLTRYQHDQLLSEKLKTRTGCYESFYQQMAKSITENGTLPVMAIDAVNVVRVIEYAMKSNEEKRTVFIESDSD
jgi:scyllo-inositol 2-dehydrogenase (NADP+)